MSTTNSKTVTSKRDLKPQWVKGGLNLGEFAPDTVGFSGEGIQELVKDKLGADGVADFMNGQLHIRFGSKLVKDLVKAELEAKEATKRKAGEKLPDWMERVYEEAKAIAARLGATLKLDYVEEFSTWLEKEFATRGEKKEQRILLKTYDIVVGFMEAKWEGMSEENRLANLAKLQLASELAGGDYASFKAALDAKYFRPVAVEEVEMVG